MSQIKRTCISKPSRGFTLIELLMAMAITGVATALAFGGYATLLNMLKTQKDITEGQLDHYEVFMTIEKDIRNAGGDPETAGLFDSSSPDVEIIPEGEEMAGGLRLRTDSGGNDSDQSDGDIDDVEEIVVYALDGGGTLNRWVATGTGGLVAQPLLQDVILFQTELLNDSGTTATFETMSQVQITITSTVSETSPGASSLPTQRTFKFTVALPNRLYAGAIEFESDEGDDDDHGDDDDDDHGGGHGDDDDDDHGGGHGDDDHGGGHGDDDDDGGGDDDDHGGGHGDDDDDDHGGGHGDDDGDEDHGGGHGR